MTAIHILLVEDNEGDIILTKEAFEEAKILMTMSVVRDGDEAINFLKKEGIHANAALPDLVLLDVNLPKKNGYQVLDHIKNNENLKHIPVIILSTSSSPNDINLAYKNYANCYITKPVDINDFFAVIASIESFWISVVKLPVK